MALLGSAFHHILIGLTRILVRPIFCGISRTNRERQNDICGKYGHKYLMLRTFLGCNTLDHPPDPWHSRNLTQIMLIFTMGIVFSLMAPLVVPIVAFYAIIALITLRNQVLYVYIQVYESGDFLTLVFETELMFSKVGGFGHQLRDHLYFQSYYFS